jgi:predicted transcriptional regulator
LETELSRGVEVVSTLADCLNAIGNPARFKIVSFCSEPRKFTEIIINLKLNPASFKFHLRVLTDYGLVEKIERGVYKTTMLGKLLIQLVETASKITDEN